MYEDIREIISKNVKYYREKSGMKREEFAQGAHIVYACLMKIERGKTLPRLDTLECIANALGLQTAQLLISRSEPEPDLSGNQCLKKFIQFSDEEQRLAVQLIETARKTGYRLETRPLRSTQRTN
jgi:transcriptional regulator with XRE-family HTH domain